MAHTEGMTMIIALAFIGGVGALASRFGADSRPGFAERSPLA